MTDQSLTPEQEDLNAPKGNLAGDNFRFPEHWILALEFVKKFNAELAASDNSLTALVRLFEILVS